MNSRADVIIIGGGIVGCSIAWQLAKRGIDVILFEKHEIGHGQSSRAWGFVRRQRRDPAELPMMIEANRMWPQLAAELDADIEWTQNGILAVAHTEQRMSYYHDWFEETREFGVESRLLTAREIHALNPDMQGSWVGGMYTPGDGHAEPDLATSAIAAAAQRLGARIETGTTVDAIDVSTGSVKGVRANGSYFAADTVILAAGAWSARLARTVDLDLPQLAIHQTVVAVDPDRPISPIATWTPEVAFRQRPGGIVYLARPDDGDYEVNLDSLRYARQFLPNYLANRDAFRMRIGKRLLEDLPRLRPKSRLWRRQFHEIAGLEPEPNPGAVERCQHSFMRLFPHIGEPAFVSAWGGAIDTTPDALPVLGEAPEVSGFVWATGFSGHGFGIAPAVGKALAQLIDEGTCDFDLTPFRPDRFSESREIRTSKIA